jgi:hypothetical protein
MTGGRPSEGVGLHSPRRSRLYLSLATLLLVLQALDAGAVAWAHARDRLPGPVSFEAQHGAKCPVLHDDLHCALCQYAGARIALFPSTIGVPSNHPHIQPLFADRPLPSRERQTPLAQPRAPPLPQA